MVERLRSWLSKNVLRAGGVTITRGLDVLEPSKPVEAGESGGEEQLDSEAGDVVDVDYSLPHLTKPMTTPGLAIGLVGQPSQVCTSAYHLLKLITNPCMRLRQDYRERGGRGRPADLRERGQSDVRRGFRQHH